MNLRRYVFIAAIIAFLYAVVVAIGQSQVTPLRIITSMLATTISVSTPLALGALSGLYCERAGVVNIGIEGMMLTAAFFGWFGAILMSSIFNLPALVCLLLGMLFAILSSVLMSLLHALLSVTFKVNQIIGGTVINILAVGITGFLNRQLFFGSNSVFGGQVPHAPGVLPPLPIPFLSKIPVIGSIFSLQPITYLAIILVAVSYFVLFKTRWGLRTRAVGEHPRAADTVGISVTYMRYMNVLIGGVMAGLAGAYLTLESVPSFEPGMTAGRGFIALAALIFGNWSPFGAWTATLVFGAAQAFQINLQQFRELIPPQWGILQSSYVVGLVPYILTMLILTGIVGKTTAPAADGEPYEK